jgi:hypothetical protein
MQIEILYFEGCPNHVAAHQQVLKAVQELGIETTIVKTNVETPSDAETKRFPGSPTVRIDGQDVDPTGAGDGSYVMRCRRYLTPDGMQGTPTSEMIKAAIHTKQAGNG